MSKRSIKFPCVWIKCLIWLQSFRGKKTTLYTQMQQRNEQTLTTSNIFEFTYNDFLCHLKLNRGKSSWVNRRKITKCSWRKHRLDSHVSKIAWKPFKFLYLYSQMKMFRWSLSLWFCVTSIFYTIHSLKHFSVYEGSRRNNSPKSFELFKQAFD